MDEKDFMGEAFKEAKKAYEKGECPVGAVIVRNGTIVARAGNRELELSDPTAHAEMIAVTQAAETLATAKKGHRGSLEGASLYVTLEPCPMCAGALIVSKCKNLIYGARDPKAGACGSLYRIPEDERFNHQLHVIGGVLADESKILLQEFFRGLRKERR